MLNNSQLAAKHGIYRTFDQKKKGSILEAPAGYGKAQPLDEPILTSSGWKLLKEVSIGEKVFSEKGELIEVLNTFESSNLNMYKLKFSDGSFTRCCEAHLWEVQTPDGRKTGKSKVLSLKEMLPEIQKEKRLKAAYTYSILLTKPVQFPFKEDLMDAYSLGYTLGNGSSSKQLILTTAIEDLKEIVNLLNKEYILSTKEKDSSVGTISFNNLARSSYASLGLKALKSKQKFIPSAYFTSSVQQRKDLLAGLLDSDGTCSTNKAKFATGSYALALDIILLIRSLGGIASLSSSLRNGETEYTVLFRTPFNPFKLARKALNYKVKANDIEANKRIVSAEFIGIMAGKCLLVDSPRRLYLTRDYTVTHNTHLLKDIIREKRFRKVLVMAETNQAVNILRSSFEETDNVDFKTVCSALNYVLEPSSHGFSLTQASAPDWSSYSLTLLDEASQMNKARFDEVKGLAKRLIVCGDSKQCPPVGEKFSPAFVEDSFSRFELDEPMRNKTEIWKFCHKLRATVGTMKMFPKDFRVSEKEFYKKIEESFGDFMLGTARIIAFSEKGAKLHAVADYNNFIKNSLFGSELPAVGERIVFKRPYCPLGEGKNPEKNFPIFTNSLGTIMEVGYEELRIDRFTIPAFKLTFRTDDYSDKLFVGYFPANEVIYESARTAVFARRDNKLTKAFFSTWMDFKPAYSVNTYVCQGLTIPKVFVDLADITACTRDNILLRQILFYVSCSRAEVELYIKA
jgi:hypothetical protein